MVVSVHDCTLVTHPAWCPPAVRHFAAVVRRAAARGAWLQTPSTYVAEQARDVFGTDRVRVVPYGPPDPPGALDSAGDIPGLESVPFVLALGKLEARKNLPRLVEAFGRLHPRQPELHLVLAGPDGPDRLAIDAAISRLPRQAARQVIITGWLDFAHRDWALRRAAALAYPSLDEGFGFPVLEAMQRGVPVVAANVGSLPEVSGDAAVLIDPHDIDALAAALELVLTNEGRRHNLIELGHRHVSTFSWHDCAEGMNVLYRNAVDAGR
jgi:glycosyltransferase involved in cell wall biosynthesis